MRFDAKGCSKSHLKNVGGWRWLVISQWVRSHQRVLVSLIFAPLKKRSMCREKMLPGGSTTHIALSMLHF